MKKLFAPILMAACCFLALPALAQTTDVQTIDTVAALRALSPPAQDGIKQIDVRGYYASGDGGGGTFYWDGNFSFQRASAANLVAGGSGYAVGDEISVPGASGAYSVPLLTVATVGPNGTITGLTLNPGSAFTSVPSGTLPTGDYLSSGTGATVTLTAASVFDDGGGNICPDGYTGSGRWRRLALVEHPTFIDVRWFGAKCENIYAPTFDSLEPIQRAIWSAPDDDYLPVQPPGAAKSGHQKKCTLYFPGNSQNLGYSVSNTIYATPEMFFRGDNIGTSILSLTINSAFPTETWIIKYLYGSNSVGNANTSFDTGVSDMILVSDTCTNGAGLFFLGCNGGYIRNVAVNSKERSIYVDSGGVVINNIRPTSTNKEGLEIHGQQIVGDYWDAEHCNSTSTGRTATTFPSGTMRGGHDLGGTPIPAIWIDATNVHVGNITGETSPIVALITGPDVDISSVSNNTYGSDSAVAGACTVRVWETDNVRVAHHNNQGLGNGTVSFAHGEIYDTRNDGSNAWTVEDGGTFGGRTSYSEQEDILNLRLFGKLDLYGSPSEVNSNGVAAMRFYTGQLNLSELTVNTSGGLDSGGYNVGVSQGTYQGGLLSLGATGPSYGIRLSGFNNGADNVGPDARYRLQIASVANGNYTPYGEITKNGWGIMKLNPQAALDVGGKANVDGDLVVNGALYVQGQQITSGERLINSYQITQATPSVTFNIPAGLHHLRLLSNGYTTSSPQCFIVAQMNGDSTISHYVRQFIRSYGSTVSGSSDTSQSGMTVGHLNTTSTPYMSDGDALISLMTIPPASQGGTPTYLATSSVQGSVYDITASQYNLISEASRWTGGTAPITSMTVRPTVGSFSTGSTLYLYGY